MKKMRKNAVPISFSWTRVMSLPVSRSSHWSTSSRCRLRSWSWYRSVSCAFSLSVIRNN